MVCSLVGGKTAAMTTILKAGENSETITEVGRQKINAQNIHREIREADEANLLDEEDMHVFGLRPMTDPLNLVCCNLCKKPVTASQYAAHAEICKSLSSIEESEGRTANKKPPRKEKKNLLTTCAVVAEPERSRKVGNNIAASGSHLDEQIQVKDSVSVEAKHGTVLMDRSVVSPGNTDYLEGSMPSPKHPKLISAESPLRSGHIESTSGITKSLSRSSQGALNCGDLNESKRGSGKTCSNVVGHQISGNTHCCYLQVKGKSDVPAPLATKIFYSQRNQRLRSAFSKLYYESSANQHGHDLVNMQQSHGNKMTSCTSSPKSFYRDQTDDDQESKNMLPSMQRSDQVFAQSSEFYLEDTRTCPLPTDFSSQFNVNNVLGPHRTPAGTIGSNYLSNPYSFADNSASRDNTAA